MKPRDVGITFAILSAVIGSISSVLTSEGTKMISPLFFASFGAIIPGLILLASLYFSKKKLNIIKNLSKFKSDFLKLIILRPIIGHVILLIGFSLTQPIRVIFFTRFEPIFVMLWGYFLFRERINSREILIVISMIFGGILLSSGGEFSSLTQASIGDLLIAVSMIFLSYSYFYAQKLSKKVGSRLTNSLALIIGGTVVIPFMLIFSGFNFSTDPSAWFYFLAYAIGFNVISLTLWYAALKTAKGWTVSALRTIGPITGASVAFLFFGNTLNIIQLIGAIIIISCVLVLAKFKK